MQSFVQKLGTLCRRLAMIGLVVSHSQCVGQESRLWPRESHSRCMSGANEVCQFNFVTYSRFDNRFYYFTPLAPERKRWQPDPNIPVKIHLGLPNFRPKPPPTMDLMFVDAPITEDPALFCDVTQPVYLHAPFNHGSYGHTLRDNLLGIANNIAGIGTSGARYKLLLFDEILVMNHAELRVPRLWAKYGPLVASEVSTWHLQLADCDRPYIRFHDIIAGYDGRTVHLGGRVEHACTPEYLLTFRDMAFRSMGLPPPTPVAHSAALKVLILDKERTDTRRIVNIRELQRHLAAEFPEAAVSAVPLVQLKVREQLRVMGETAVFISTAGSASFRLMFLPTGAHVIIVGPLEGTEFNPLLNWIELDHCWDEAGFLTFHRYRVLDAAQSIENTAAPLRVAGDDGRMFRWWDADKIIEPPRMAAMLRDAFDLIRAASSVAANSTAAPLPLTLSAAGRCGTVWGGGAPPLPRPVDASGHPLDPPAVLHALYGSAFDPQVQTGDAEIIVLGMHNSGTSITTRLLMLMGAFAGNKDEIVIDPGNRLKLYERDDMMTFHDVFLMSHTDRHFAAWHAQNYSLHQPSAQAVEELQRGAAKALASVRRHSPSVLKDPRLCLTLDFWKPLLRNPFCVIVAADSSRIAYGLAQGAKNINHLTQEAVMSPERFMVTWEASMIYTVRACVGVPTFMFFTETMSAANVMELTRQLFDGLTYIGVQGLRLPSADDLDREVVAYFRGGHKHSRAGDALPRAPMTPRQRSLEKAINHYTASTAEKACSFDPSKVAQDILDYARLDMGEDLWQSLVEQYPVPSTPAQTE